MVVMMAAACVTCAEIGWSPVRNWLPDSQREYISAPGRAAAAAGRRTSPTTSATSCASTLASGACCGSRSRRRPSGPAQLSPHVLSGCAASGCRLPRRRLRACCCSLIVQSRQDGVLLCACTRRCAPHRSHRSFMAPVVESGCGWRPLAGTCSRGRSRTTSRSWRSWSIAPPSSAPTPGRRSPTMSSGLRRR